MDWLEKELSQALKRKEPSPDFAARVAARVAAQGSTTAMDGGREAGHRPDHHDTGQVGDLPHSRRWVATLPRWLPAAAAVLVIAGGSGVAWRRHQGMVAKEQVMLAMRITAGKLNHIQEHMREARP
jgi:hypothetical protein